MSLINLCAIASDRGKKIHENVHINYDSRPNLFADILTPYVLDWQKEWWLGHISPKICLLEPFHHPPLLSDWVRPSLSCLAAWARHFCNGNTALVDGTAGFLVVI